MKKYEKIRENIIIMQQINSRKIENQIEEFPGPTSYNPCYKLTLDSGYAVN